MAVVYAPVPMNGLWPSEICPETPVPMLRPSTATANAAACVNSTIRGSSKTKGTAAIAASATAAPKTCSARCAREPCSIVNGVMRAASSYAVHLLAPEQAGRTEEQDHDDHRECRRLGHLRAHEVEVAAGHRLDERDEHAPDDRPTEAVEPTDEHRRERIDQERQHEVRVEQRPR